MLNLQISTIGANSRSSVCEDLGGFLFSGLNCTSLVLSGGCLSSPIINASCPASCGHCGWYLPNYSVNQCHKSVIKFGLDFNQTRHAKAIQTDTEMDASLAGTSYKVCTFVFGRPVLLHTFRRCLACCIEEGVPQNCNICSFGSTVSSLVQAGLGCIPYVDKFASCAAGIY